MSPFGSDFVHTEYASIIDSKNSVILGDGSTRLNILGKGTIERWVETNPGNYQRIRLENVLHVDGIQRRFLSSFRLNRKGLSVNFTPSGPLIQDETRTLSIKGFNAGPASFLSVYRRPPNSIRLNAVESLPLKLWHERMGHLNWDAIKRTRQNQPPLVGIQLDQSEPHGTCPGCIAGKDKRRTFKSSSGSRATEPLERIHADLNGPMETTSIGGHRFAAVFIDCYSRYTWIFHLKSKDKTLESFQTLHRFVENLTSRKLKIFHSDRGGEFMSNEFTKYLEENGIARSTSAPRTPQQNGLAERMNLTLAGSARAMLAHSGLSKGFWAEAMHVATHIHNRSPRKALLWKTPHELFFGRIPDVSYFRVFGCRAWVHTPPDQRKKWDAKAIPMILVGYESGSKAYRLWNPATRSITVSASVRFDESDFPNRPKEITPTPLTVSSSKLPASVHVPWISSDEDPLPSSPPAATIVEDDKRAVTSPSSSTPQSPTCPSSSSTSQPPSPTRATRAPSTPPPQQPTEPPPSPNPEPRTSKRERKRVDRYDPSGKTGKDSGLYEISKPEGDLEEKFVEAYLRLAELAATTVPSPTSSEPRNYQEAVSGPDAEKWKAAINEEITSLEELETWEVVPIPKDRKVISCKWVWRIKTDAQGQPARYKARLVARGFTQVPGLDFTDTFAPVTRLETIRLLFALAVEKDWEVRQIDVKTAYLHGELDEEIYMEAPEGYDVPEGHCLRLLKALYGLKQAGRQWYRKLKETLGEFSLTQVANEPNTFVTHKYVDGVKRTLVLPVYVDDLFPMGDKVLTDDFEVWVNKYFKTSPPTDASYLLGIRITRDRYSETPSLTLDQKGYIDNFLRRLNFIPPSRISPTPLSSSSKAQLVKNPSPKEDADPIMIHEYSSAIGCLMYLMLGTRPDLAFAVGRLSAFSHNPSRDHFLAVGRVLNYVHNSSTVGLRYYRTVNEGAAIPFAHADASYNCCNEDGKSISGHVFFLGNAAFSWYSKKQSTVATSTMEAEYIAVFAASQQAAWVRHFFELIGFPLSSPLTIHCDNEATLAVSKGEQTHSKSKHLNPKLHSVRERIESNQIELEYVASASNIADVLTKALPEDSFVSHSNSLGLLVL
jgi:transposase InsO family protein